jgi:HEAT repeat protein
MVHADAAAAAEAFGRMLPTVAAPELRRALVMACARTGNAEGQKALLQAATGDADETVRLTAVQHLARFPGPEVREALQKIAENDPDGAVRQEADRILKTLRPAERPEGQGENPPPVEKPPDGN